jgi:hypothetical protein
MSKLQKAFMPSQKKDAHCFCCKKIIPADEAPEVLTIVTAFGVLEKVCFYCQVINADKPLDNWLHKAERTAFI